MPETETPAATAEASLPANPDGATPPERQPEQAQQDKGTKEEQARAVLKGEAPKDEPLDPNDINNQFDPETGELLEEDPTQPAEAVAEAEPEPEVKEADEDDEKKAGKKNRFRFDNDEDKAIALMARSKGISLAKAATIYLEQNPAQKAEVVRQEAPAEAAPTVEQLNAKIAEIRAAREAAAETMDVKGLNRLNDELADLREQLSETKRAQQTRQQSAEQEAQKQFAKAEGEAIAQAVSIYPDADVEGSELNDAISARRAELERSNPAFFRNPRWALTLAVEVATDKGIMPKAKGAPVKTAPVVPKKPTRPAPSPAPGNLSSASTNPEAAIRARLATARKNNDAEGIKAIMRELTPA